MSFHFSVAGVMYTQRLSIVMWLKQSAFLWRFNRTVDRKYL